MKVKVTIETGNAAFGEGAEDRAHEVARILATFAKQLDGAGLERGDEWTLRDINGNTVGQVKVTR